MTPRPVIRWKSFWLGILVLGFLGWTWARSGVISEGVVVTIRDARTMFWAYERGGELCFHFIDDGPYDSTRFDAFYENASGFGKLPPPFTYSDIEVDLSTSATRIFSVAHWFLMLLFFLPWAGFLAWRLRKQRKLTDANP